METLPPNSSSGVQTDSKKTGDAIVLDNVMIYKEPNQKSPQLYELFAGAEVELTSLPQSWLKQWVQVTFRST